MAGFAQSHEELIPLGVEDHLAAGGHLWHEGDAGHEAVVLLEGILEVVHETPGAESEVVVLRTLEPRALVGELALLDGSARSATVRAQTDVKFVRVAEPAFKEFLRRRPDLLEELFWQQVERVRTLTRDVTRTHKRAITDPLTQLYNFGFFRERLRLELERAQVTGDLVSLVIFDIDHFKHYNDRNGHQEGNAALVKVGELLRSTGRRGDIVARYGGEEFVALLYGATREEAWRFAETFRVSVETSPFEGGPGQPLGRLTVSGGVAAYPTDAADDETLLAAADRNLYRAKAEGRNRVVATPPPPPSGVIRR